MITGIGTDLVSIERMRGLVARHGARAASRILAAQEMAGYASAADPASFLAKRFAAKEAFAKATGSGVRAPVTLREVAVEHDALGRPSLAFSGALHVSMQARGLTAHLSLSDEAGLALAFVVIEHDGAPT
ncbi:MAG TPA: holo-ACP synthase [Rhodocyclaceae bacterium]|nr:MAG: holo-ACP synthase [Betaproteobacteria bacterium CG2_30_68_42]PIV74100.1 MAG: holo-ACP synthase [Rhodocyclales bacterium CG17_big_fil_post_rev_8_21_14_2_50_68_7]PJA57428.1 MAG: holo-ACP synthase [Rhodocyclales bacterium CG_4_9_14_3_um_filter_68_10]HCX32263.1 holo-ACP synthase [Rhodocyclaceae bacterium]